MLSSTSTTGGLVGRLRVDGNLPERELPQSLLRADRRCLPPTTAPNGDDHPAAAALPPPNLLAPQAPGLVVLIVLVLVLAVITTTTITVAATAAAALSSTTPFAIHLASRRSSPQPVAQAAAGRATWPALSHTASVIAAILVLAAHQRTP